MRSNQDMKKPAFTLFETVIAIGVLAVLLTGFLVVFAPAAAGIKRAIDVQEADRLVSTLEQELVTVRTGQGYKTGFEKAFELIKGSNDFGNPLVIYQYRGSVGNSSEPVSDAKSTVAGEDYVVQSVVRRVNDPEFDADLKALEGSLYLVKITQLVFDSNGGMKPGTAGQIVDPKPSGGGAAPSAEDYSEAVIVATADFFALGGTAKQYFSSKGFKNLENGIKNGTARPVFSRNIAVRR